MPPAVSVASLAADGVSYVTTGKSVAEHGISAATGHDCALLRPVLPDKPVCDTTLGERGREIPVEQGQARCRGPMPWRRRRRPRPGPATSRSGVFSIPPTPRAWRHAMPSSTQPLPPAEVKGRHFYRVMVGPLSSEETAALELRLAAL